MSKTKVLQTPAPSPAKPEPPDLVTLMNEAEQIGWLQTTSEMLAFCGWLSKYKIDNFLEIGTYKGGTFHVWSTLAGPGIHISISADLPMGPRRAANELDRERREHTADETRAQSSCTQVLKRKSPG